MIQDMHDVAGDLILCPHFCVRKINLEKMLDLL